MKKITKLLLVGITTLLFTGCGGGGSDTPTSTETVNLLGTWDYLIITQNSICDGLAAQGSEVVDDLNGDTSKIGDIYLEGTGFAVDGNQNCYLTNISETITDARGLPSEMTASQFKQFIEDANAGDNTIASIRIDSFTDRKIVEVFEFTNGVIITETLTR